MQKPISQQLLDIAPSASDRMVAMMLADKCIGLTDKPYRFVINHDIRPPKNLACPLRYDWTRKDRCGLETNSALEARQWLTKALMLGYTVRQTDFRRAEVGFTHSLAIARRRAALHQSIRDNPDDDIPF